MNSGQHVVKETSHRFDIDSLTCQILTSQSRVGGDLEVWNRLTLSPLFAHSLRLDLADGK